MIKKIGILTVILIIAAVVLFLIKVPKESCTQYDMCGVTLEGGCWKQTTCKVVGQQSLLDKLLNKLY